MARHGAVAIVRQLAQDLAQRDMQMTKLRQAAEERERALKKMLLECQISSLDIEARLRTVDEPHTGFRRDLSGKSGNHPQKETSNSQHSIDEMMNQAMSDDLEMLTRSQSQVVQSSGVFGDSLDADDERHSLAAKDDGLQRSKATMRGWKEYLWSGHNTSRKASGASSVVSELNQDVETAIRSRSPSNRRGGLQEDLFEPPSKTAEYLQGNANRSASSQRSSVNGSDDSRKTSSSIASWALKLVAGTTQGNQVNDGVKPLRGRAATAASEATHGSRRSSNASTKPPSAAKAALRKVNNQATSSQSGRRSGASLSLGPNGTVKGTTTSDGRWQKSSNLTNQAGPRSPMSVKDTSESGPVEMDTILPEDSRPPVLTPMYKLFHPSDLLTDNFGFIYDQRQKKKERERAESIRSGTSDLGRVEMLRSGKNGLTRPADEREEKKEDQISGTAAISMVRTETPESANDNSDAKLTTNWQDYLKAPTFPTELLSHTPSAGVLPTFSTLSAGISDHFTAQGSISNPQSMPNPATAGNVTLVQPTLSGLSTPSTIKSQAEPVKMLLEQLTELHDTLQSEKTIRWNDFLRKVRAERRKEDEAAMPTDGRLNRHTMPEISLTDGEMIGVAGLGNKGKVGRAKWKEFKSLVLGGIPVSYRAKIWSECSGASALKIPGYYEGLVNDGVDDPVVASQIAMDIHRTLTDNIFFRKGPGVEKLNEVLLAYARRNPEVGYCQGMNLITASLLLIMPTAEDAFWILTSLIETILPPNYYDHSLLASRADQQVLRNYVSEILPRLSAHLDELGIELEALTFQWFLSVFTDCLSAEALFRVWDVILCTNDGSTFIFQVALALLKLNERHLLACEAPASVYSYINHQMTNHAISIDGLVHASDALKNVVKRGEMEERRSQAVKAEKEAMAERARRAKERESKHEAGKAASETPKIATELATASTNEDHDESIVDLDIQDPIPIDEIEEAERKLKSFETVAQ